jgi:hypothetical protein
MAVSIPIISEFDPKGINKAIAEFKQLETAGEKAKFALKKAAVPAAAAFTALAGAVGLSVNAAIQDAEAQELLARQLRASAKATDAVIAGNERWISSVSMSAAVADDELRPALSRLVTATGEITSAQDLLQIGLNVSAATGKDLATVSEALARGYAGNTKALGALSPELKAMIKDGADFNDVLEILDYNFKGAAETAANTAAGGMRRLSISLGEAQESLGAAFLPVVQAAIPYLQKFAEWAMANPDLLKKVVLGVGGLTAAIVALNVAMSLNPVSLIVIGLAALGTALVVAYNKFEGFRKVVDVMFAGFRVGFDLVKGYFSGVLGFYKAIFNGIADLWNNTIGKLSFKVPSWVPGLGGKGFEVPNIPKLADGGIVSAPTLALIGEAGPEAVVPLDRMSGMGGGVTINVQGGDPRAIVDALQTYMSRYGAVPIRTVAP